MFSLVLLSSQGIYAVVDVGADMRGPLVTLHVLELDLAISLVQHRIEASAEHQPLFTTQLTQLCRELEIRDSRLGIRVDLDSFNVVPLSQRTSYTR